LRVLVGAIHSLFFPPGPLRSYFFVPLFYCTARIATRIAIPILSLQSVKSATEAAIATMFGQVRTNRSTALMAATIIFLVAFVGLAYNHLDKWEPPADV
jgi:hypothetical protein